MKKIRKYIPTLVVLCTGVLISLVLYDFERNEEIKEKNEYVEYHILERRYAIENVMNSNLKILSLFQHDWDLPYSEFKQLAEPIIKSHENILNICLIKRVAANKKSELEKTSKERRLDDFYIKELNEKGEFINVFQRDFYYPAIFSEPTHINGLPISGFDFGSKTNSNSAINEAIRTGELALANCKIFIKESELFGLLAILPIFDLENSLKGLIVARFEVDEILSKNLSKFKKEDISLNIFDVTDSLHRIRIGSFNPKIDSRSNKKDSKFIQNTYMYSIDIANKKWELEFHSFNHVKKDEQALILLIVGLLFTAMISSYLIIRTKRTEKIRGLSQQLKAEIIEKNIAEEILTKNENKFRLLYENAPLSYQSLDINGNFIDVNKTWLETLGYERWEVIGKHFTDFMTEESAKLANSRFNCFIKDGVINEAEFEMIRKDNSHFFMSLHGKIGYDLNGNFKQTHCIFQDITERKRVENEIRKHQYYLEKAQEIGNIGTWEIDVVQNTLTWTKENYNIFGLPENSEINFDIFIACIHPDDREFVNLEFEKALLSKNYDIEHRIIANGEVKWIREKADFLFDEKNVCNKVVGVSQDITQIKRVQQKVIRNESSLQKIIAETVNKGGKDYFENMVLAFDEILKPDYLFIGELIENKSVNTISLVSKGKILDNFSYELKDTPCEKVIGIDTCFHNKNVAELFPKDQLLIDMGIEAYIGTPLFDSKKSGIGIIVALYKKPIIEVSFIRSMFEIFAANIGSEIQRTKTDQILQESEEKFRNYFQSNLAPMIILDIETKNIKDINKSAESFYRYSRSEFLEKTIYDLNTLSNNEINLKMKEAVSKKSNYLMFRHQLSDGSEKDVEVYSTIFKDADTTLMYLIVHDITARLIAEQALFENEEKYRAAFRTSPDAINISTIEGVYIDTNEGFTKITGYTREDVIGESAFEKNIWANPMDRDILISELKNKGECNNLEAVFRCKNGETITGLLSAKFILIDGIQHILSITRDITKQKERDKLVLKTIIDTEEKERKRFAEDLHDELGPFLSGIKLYIKELGYQDVSYEQRISIIEYLNEFINSAVEKTRSISNQLMPNVLTNYGLVKALNSFCSRINNTKEINIEFKSNITDSIKNSTIEVILYRIAIELINNTIKHAGANKIDINLSKFNEIIQLTYIDNGKGFDIEKELKKENGLGLINIVNRLNSIKGKYSFKKNGKGMHFNIIIDLSLS